MSAYFGSKFNYFPEILSLLEYISMPETKEQIVQKRKWD